MVIYLQKGNLSAFIQNYDSVAVSNLTSYSEMLNTRLALSLPKFEYTVSNPLKMPLLEMGMTLPFDEANADLTTWLR